MDKHCNRCDKTKPVGEFTKRKDTGDYASNCKKCRAEMSKLWRENNPEKFKAITERAKPKQKEYYASGRGKIQSRKGLLKRTYNIDFADYEFLLEEQGYVCAICGKPETRNKTKNLSVDHCHATGKVRGLLCAKCNSALGHMEDNIINLQNAIKYLEKHKPTNLYIP